MSKMSTETSNSLSNFPLISDNDFANQKLKDFLQLYNETYPAEIYNENKNIIELADNKKLLLSIFSNSPYLTSILFKYPAFSLKPFNTSADKLVSEILLNLSYKPGGFTSLNELMQTLRIAKAEIALTIGIADLSGNWTLSQITKGLSEFAEIALRVSINFLMKQAISSGDLCHDVIENDHGRRSGYTILAMGKLGGYELNYSSDIDLIVLFDLEITKYSGRRSAQDFFVKMTQKLVKIMADRTADGYVFRTDLRLRPDPGATPVALSMEGAEFYYQSVGLNWERAAMIKARPIAGDIEAGYAFLERIRGFVWRRHLDYAAIEDIHAIKNLIHKHHSHKNIMLRGHDVKLGRGGIREIEFYAQIHQLISGGREPVLRIAPTRIALDALCMSKKLSMEENNTLQTSYIFLRTLEHRLQMVNDDQTHEIPTADDDLMRICKFMGYETLAQFEATVLEKLNAVHLLFNNLLENTNQTTPEEGLSFPLDKYLPSTLEAIESHGFKEPKKTYELIQNWMIGRYRACRTERARNILKKLTPDILAAFGKHQDPDAALIKFDDFLSKLPSGIQLFSFIKAQPWLLDLLAEITAIAPFLSNQLSRKPLLLDSVLSADPLKENSSLKQLKESLDDQLVVARDFQDILDITRIWTNEGKFQVGLQILRGNTDVSDIGRALTHIAEASLDLLLDEVKKEFAKKHGIIENSSLCILAMGKLGGYEFTTTSDVDMILIYEAADMETVSNGAKPLSVNHYYARLSQNFINSITALTAEGKLYEVDMRLRPSGTAGPLAVSLESFNDYQHGAAWTWEHMALTRGRVISGTQSLKKKIDKCIFNILSHKGRDQNNLLYEVCKMRHRLRDNFGTDNMWAMKHVPGGIVDIEFICQYLLLKNGDQHPEILEKNTIRQIERFIELDILSNEVGNALKEACHTLQTIQALLRLSMGTTSKNDDRPEALLTSLAERLSCKVEDLESLIKQKQKFVLDLYNEIIEIPASKIIKPEPTAPLDHN